MAFNSPELSQLLTRCRGGDEDGWKDLLNQFDVPVTQWIARLNPFLTVDEINDLRQDVFAKVIRSFHDYDEGKASFKTWLYQQTYSKGVDQIRKDNALSNRPAEGFVHLDATEADGEEERPKIQLASQERAPDELAARQDEFGSLFTALQQMGPSESRCRQLIELHYFGGFKYAEIAEMRQMNEKTVSSALSRCLVELRAVFAKVFRE
jgi:RNA polymerase sigma factor (sigma-70 family)